MAKGKRRTGEEPVDKATLQKHRHMIKSRLLGPGNANRGIGRIREIQVPLIHGKI